jgi:hypothetical protein
VVLIAIITIMYGNDKPEEENEKVMANYIIIIIIIILRTVSASFLNQNALQCHGTTGTSARTSADGRIRDGYNNNGNSDSNNNILL